jgi:hypothetical protein
VIQDITKSDNKMTTQHPYSEAVFNTAETDPEKEVRQDDEKSGTSSPRISDHLKESHIPEITSAPSDGGERDPEYPNDVVFHQVIVKDGREVLVSWTPVEQARVVRKADFLFLPLFAVRISRELGATLECPIHCNSVLMTMNHHCS